MTPRDTRDSRSLPKRRPGPKPRGRTVVPLTITVTHAQRAGLETLADTEKISISTIVRRFVAAGLAPAPPRDGATHRSRSAHRAAKERTRGRGGAIAR